MYCNWGILFHSMLRPSSKTALQQFPSSQAVTALSVGLIGNGNAIVVTKQLRTQKEAE